MKKVTSQTEFKKNVIPKEVFEREIEMCRKLNRKSGGKGCNWGECDKCGAIPLLYKLYEGILIEDSKEVEKIKKKKLCRS